MEQNTRNRPRMHHNPIFSADMPLGLGMALARNPVALDRFSKLNEDEKRELMDSVHGVGSKAEMRAFVDHFAESGARIGGTNHIF